MKRRMPWRMAALLCIFLSACAQQQPQADIAHVFRDAGLAEADCPATLAIKAYC